MNPREIGERIRRLRYWRRLSQEALADFAGRTGRWLCNVEQGRSTLTLRDVERLALGLRVDEAVLHGYAPMPPSLPGSTAVGADSGVIPGQGRRRRHGGGPGAPSGRQAPEGDVSGQTDATAVDTTGHVAAVMPFLTQQRDVPRETLWRPAGVGISSAFTPDDEERVALAMRRPMRVDARVVDSLAKILAAQRRTEDTIGSASLVQPVTAQLATIEDLAVDARGPARWKVVDIAAQWAEFAGWLHTSTGRWPEARVWFDRASEWAMEAGDATLVATSFSFKGYLAFLLGQIGSMVGLTQAAQRDGSVWIGQRAYDTYQEARGLALLGDVQAAAGKVSEGTELAAHADEQSDARPPWIYYYTAAFYALERGLTYRYLGRDDASYNDEAIASLSAALANVGESRSSEWVGEYVYHLAVAYLQAGAPDQACETAMEVVAIARATESVRLVERLRVMHARLAQRWPDDPHVIELGEALRR